jgi:hypothetical protein
MPRLSAAAALDLWEAAQGLEPTERSLLLAADEAAGPPARPEELARLPLGERDARLLRLRADLAGTLLEATASCPGCAQELEFAVATDALLARADERAEPEPVVADGLVVTWRPLESADVAAAAATADAAAAERVLLERCVTAVTGPDGDRDLRAPDLPPEARAAVAEAMAAADPLAEVLVELACPSCGAAFAADLDVGGFVWAELRAHAQRLLRAVDVLARAYGWREADVLGLSERRRDEYLGLALGGGA